MNLAAIATISLAGMITTPCFASDAPEIDIARIASYRTKIHSHGDDLLSIGKSARSLDDKGMLLEVACAAGDVESEIAHLEELLRIKSLMLDQFDKKTISGFISDDIKIAIKVISLDIERVNLNMANLKSSAAVTEASKLKDDLHGLKELLQP